MSATERMISYHLSRLSDKNPQIRIKSIEELALLEATNAYKLLEEMFHTDPDPDVRKAAQKAGRALYMKLRENENSGDNAG
ncbi:MAG: HEAT repeat domain-containing protein [Chloroflexi bacterium]|nr:HEAT repeat domain-containing protein [Chloroflexota bacterium]